MRFASTRAVMPRPTLLSWSSGKDSAYALHVLRQQTDIEVVGLLTTVDEAHARVAIHGVRVGLLRAQAAATGLPLREVPLPSPCPNAEYEARMGAALAQARAEGVAALAFGDLFLEEIRRYREDSLRGTGLDAVFPLWGEPTPALARRMLALGLRARITCIDPRRVGREVVGRDFDEALLDGLPHTVDPCGERGELHTFAYAGPMFRHPIGITTGETVERDGFVFADLLPAPAAA
ncbi:ATP-binding protein [Chondromyces crocatus]|uniref:ATP-binding protein n=2 Tax=Chondromyces crocatus TaxID=52 RepID=A0A0K1EAU2_CHOCO|nr:ATP-binding protein [Chondromyces crocatus]